MEKLLHYVWKYKIFPLKALLANTGSDVDVISPGLPNPNAGPDFFNAKIKIGDTLWAGNIEIHLRSSDWYRHNHHLNPEYNNVILHVVQIIDSEIETENGKKIPQLQLDIPAQIQNNYHTLSATQDYPRCFRVIPHLEPFWVHNWMSVLLYERLEQRASLILKRLEQQNGDWENTFFITLARNFGFGINGDAFEYWAQHIPLNAVKKHRDKLFQIEAIFMGQAGLLDFASIPEVYQKTAIEEGYYNQLFREYQYLAHKFSLLPQSFRQWKFLRLRPQNFPHIRISQLAQLFYRQNAVFSAIMECENINQAYQILQSQATDYWKTHYIFGSPGKENAKHLSESSLNLLIINTIVPMLYAYGLKYTNDTYCSRATSLLDQIRAENNYIIRQWKSCTLEVKSASDSQALIQLKKEYCDKQECLRCRFGYEFIQNQKTI